MQPVVPKKKKTGLQVTSVSKDHWSVGGHASKAEGCRLVITVLHGKGLLASDVFTGKSDPICFLWCGPSATIPGSDAAAQEIMAVTDTEECAGLGILRTNVCPTTLEPVWNEDIVFPLSIDDTYSLSQLRVVIYVRDEDIDEVEGGEETSYDELGMCEISLKDILIGGKARRRSISDVSRQLNLKSCLKMKKKAEGYIKVTCTLIFDEAECKKLYPEIADGISSLDVFVLKYQQLLKDRNEKENGPQSLWGRAPSPLAGGRRPLTPLGDSTGEGTGRTTSRTSWTSRSRSPQTPQVAPRIRTSAPTTSSSEKDKEGGGEGGGGGGRPSRVPQLDYNGRGKEDQAVLQDVQEGDEEGEGDGLDNDELLIIPQDGVGEVALEKEGLPSGIDTKGGEGSPLGVFSSLIPSIALPVPSLIPAVTDAPTQLQGTDKDKAVDTPVIATSIPPSAPTSSSSLATPLGVGVLEGGVAQGSAQAQGNATAAARSLREGLGEGYPRGQMGDQKGDKRDQKGDKRDQKGDKRNQKRDNKDQKGDQKQQSIEYISKLSPGSIVELSQLLSAMEGRKEENSVKADLLPSGDVNSGRRKKGSAEKKSDKEKDKENERGKPSDENKDKEVAAVDREKKEEEGRKKEKAAARPDLKEFKRQQQEARRRSRENDPLGPLPSPGGNNMPVAELLMKAPNSGEIIRATLDRGGMVMVPRGGDEGSFRPREVEEPPPFSFPSSFPSGGDRDLPPDRDEDEGYSVKGPLRDPRDPHPAPRRPHPDRPHPDFVTRPNPPSSSSSSGLRLKPFGRALIEGRRVDGGSNVDWAAVQLCLSAGDALAAFSLVVERGELEDLALIMEAVGPKPYLLSLSIRNRVYDGIATILSQSQSRPGSKGDRLTERCLFWILALLRGNKQNRDGDHNSGGDNGMGLGMSLSLEGGMGQRGDKGGGGVSCAVSGHTKRDLRESLEQVGREKSKRGLLAALLIYYF